MTRATNRRRLRSRKIVRLHTVTAPTLSGLKNRSPKIRMTEKRRVHNYLRLHWSFVTAVHRVATRPAKNPVREANSPRPSSASPSSCSASSACVTLSIFASRSLAAELSECVEIGALEILMTPSKDWSSSKIRKIDVKTVYFCSALSSAAKRLSRVYQV